ncbi:diguanylate cyclase/phosphodiesterase [Spirochaeta thermophila DSM 6578]|uniref:Diguanylate cyclase/phosphodiesterase n=1 Tax=Winmispira thermophila (strain ATCC 700085 / DSM 6578 / Z-1203) TaxID=869211 RepID=G0GBU3_WINT7|nr:GGDEF domain-containing phosphodiesterase [Spirochaeta thermophila]AEJ61954.1 diguanylate cyclase/phosphodiesterase [Spirochaeta thermophila DSM 6578]
MSPRLRGVFAVVGLVLVGVTARYALPFLGVWVFPLMFLSLGGVLAAGLRGAGLVWGVVWVGFFLWADWRGYGGYLPGGWVWLIGGVEGSALVEYAIRLRRDRALLLRVVEGLMEGAAHPVMVSVGGRVWVNARLCEEWMLRIEPGKGYPIESVSMLLGGASVEKLKGMLEGREEEAVLEVGGRNRRVLCTRRCVAGECVVVVVEREERREEEERILPPVVRFQEYLASRGEGAVCAVIHLASSSLWEVGRVYGRGVQQQIIARAMERIRSLMRPSDEAWTTGEDRFLLVAGGMGERGKVVGLLRRILSSCNRPYVVEGRRFDVSWVAGAAVYPSDSRYPARVVEVAELALEHALKEGRAYSLHEEGWEQRFRSLVMRRHELHRALERNELVLFYQPFVDKEGTVVGAEALLRWNHPDEGILSPGEFLSLLEDKSLILPLGKWVVAEVCGLWARMREQGILLPFLSLNVAPPLLREGEFISFCADRMIACDIPRDVLMFELTERSFLSLAEEEGVFESLRGMGISLCVDDFGTGYSSFNYLKRCWVRAIKLDHSFVEGVPERREDVAIVQSVMRLAGDLGIVVIAEGVERREQVAFLSAQGCEVFQGFYYARPMPEEQFLLVVQERGSGRDGS